MPETCSELFHAAQDVLRRLNLGVLHGQEKKDAQDMLVQTVALLPEDESEALAHRVLTYARACKRKESF